MTASDVYLTVDLDFWDPRCFSISQHPERKSLAFVKRLLRHGCPVTLYRNHSEVLADFHRREFCAVVNVDFHDDIVMLDDLTTTPLNASWVNHVPNRHRMIYQWRYPNRQRCCVERLGLCQRPTDRLWPMLATDWAHIMRQEGVRGLPWSHIKCASVVLSPRYSCPLYVMPAVEHLLRSRKVARSKAVLDVVEEWRGLFPW